MRSLASSPRKERSDCEKLEKKDYKGLPGAAVAHSSAASLPGRNECPWTSDSKGGKNAVFARKFELKGKTE